MKGAPGEAVPNSFNMKDQFWATNATRCGIAELGPGVLFAASFYEMKAGVSEADARKFLSKLNQDVATCLGSGRTPRPGSDGGTVFANGPNADIAATHFIKNDDGTYEVFLMVPEDGTKLE